MACDHILGAPTSSLAHKKEAAHPIDTEESHPGPDPAEDAPLPDTELAHMQQALTEAQSTVQNLVLGAETIRGLRIHYSKVSRCSYD